MLDSRQSQEDYARIVTLDSRQSQEAYAPIVTLDNRQSQEAYAAPVPLDSSRSQEDYARIVMLELFRPQEHHPAQILPLVIIQPPVLEVRYVPQDIVVKTLELHLPRVPQVHLLPQDNYLAQPAQRAIILQLEQLHADPVLLARDAKTLRKHQYHVIETHIQPEHHRV
jgi:hypothetical protein